MAVWQLDDELWFPNPRWGEDNGLVAVGGDLSVERLLLAYSNGFFPWYAFQMEREPHWYCPLDRYVIFPKEIHVSHSMRQLLRQHRYDVTVNQDFDGVIRGCSQAQGRNEESGAWLGPDIIEAFTHLHRRGHAASVEVWELADNAQGRRLVGGLYGVTLRKTFSARACFHWFQMPPSSLLSTWQELWKALTDALSTASLKPRCSSQWVADTSCMINTCRYWTRMSDEGKMYLFAQNILSCQQDLVSLPNETINVRHIMNRKMILWVVVPLLLASCKQHYEVASVQRSRILVDSRYDRQPDAGAAEFLQPYKHVVDSVMGPVVGRSAKYMTAQRPEGTLSNLLADILMWAAKDYNEQPDFAVYNMGGVRADLSKGDVTYGDVLDIAPFENKIAFASLNGAEVTALFSEIASTGGEGMSSSVRLVITKDGKLESATIGGQSVDPQREYRVATIDYLLGGTDKMTTFAKSRNINSPKETSNNTRFIIMNYFRELQKQGREVDAEIEGRVIVK